MNYIVMIGALLEQLAGLAAGATSGQVGNIISLLERIIPFVVQEATDLLQPIQNVIAALQGNGNVTADQVAQLQAQSDAIDAALDAVAKDDNLTGA